MKIALFGASGMIGSRIATEALVARPRGHRLHPQRRPAPRRRRRRDRRPVRRDHRQGGRHQPRRRGVGDRSEPHGRQPRAVARRRPEPRRPRHGARVALRRRRRLAPHAGRHPPAGLAGLPDRVPRRVPRRRRRAGHLPGRAAGPGLDVLLPRPRHRPGRAHRHYTLGLESPAGRRSAPRTTRSPWSTSSSGRSTGGSVSPPPADRGTPRGYAAGSGHEQAHRLSGTRRVRPWRRSVSPSSGSGGSRDRPPARRRRPTRLAVGATGVAALHPSPGRGGSAGQRRQRARTATAAPHRSGCSSASVLRSRAAAPSKLRPNARVPRGALRPGSRRPAAPASRASLSRGGRGGRAGDDGRRTGPGTPGRGPLAAGEDRHGRHAHREEQGRRHQRSRGPARSARGPARMPASHGLPRFGVDVHRSACPGSSPRPLHARPA